MTYWKYHIIRPCENVCVKTQSYRSVTFSSNEIKARVVYSGYFRKGLESALLHFQRISLHGSAFCIWSLNS